MKIFNLIFFFSGLLLVSCDQPTESSSISVDSKLANYIADSIRMSDSITKAYEAIKKSDSIQNLKSNVSIRSTLDQFRESTDINYALAIEEDNIVYSKTFSPSIL